MFGFWKGYTIGDFEFASMDKDYPRLKKLIRKAKDINETDQDGRNALMYALADGLDFECIQLLIDCGADVNSVDKQQWTPLHIAASYQNLEAVKLLIQQGAQIEVKNAFGNTPLLECVGKEVHMDIVRLLLEHGADPDMKNNAGSSAREVAAATDDQQLIEVFDQYDKVKEL